MPHRSFRTGCAASWLLAAAHAAAQTPDAARRWSAGDEVVVTATRDRYTASDAAAATRTATPILTTPQSIGVVTRALIEDQDRRTLADALVNVAGVVPVRQEETLFTQPIVRGFPAEIYLDGLPAYGTTAAIDPTSLVGVERIEVVRGPTSTVYGGGAGAPLGGLVNVVAKRPGAAAGGTFALRGGSFGTVDPFADFDLPVTGRIGARLSGEYQRNGSWIDRVTGRRWSLQPSLAWQAGQRTSLLLRAQYDRRENREYSGLPAVEALAGLIDRHAYPGAGRGQPRTTTDNRLVTGEWRQAIGDAARLTVTARYYDGRSRDYGSYVQTAPDAAAPTTFALFKLFLPTRVREGTLDANLLLPFALAGGRHRLLVGANGDATDFDAAVGGGDAAIGTIDLARPRYDVAFGAVPQPFLTQTNRYRTIAAYVQDQADYGPLTLSGSLRYTRFTLRQREQGYDRIVQRVTPRVGATVTLAPGLAAFAGYVTGFRAPLNFVGAAQPRPETSRSVEGGIKLASTRIGLSGTLAAFEATRRNIAVADPDPARFGQSIQTGEQRARGVEADAVWEPNTALSVLATYAHTDAAVTRDTLVPVGDRLPRVPRHSGRAAIRYRITDGPARGLAFGAGVTALTARAITLPNSVAVPGYAAIDAQVAYDIGRFTLAASFANLGGRRGFDAFQYLALPVVIPIQPRSAFVTLKTRIGQETQ